MGQADMLAELRLLVRDVAEAKAEYDRLRFDEDQGRKLAPPASPEQITRLERELGRRLPPSYRAFLELHNGWSNFAGGSRILGTEDHGQTWVKERIAFWNSIVDDGPSPFELGAVPVLFGEDENHFLAMDPKSARPDGETDFVDYDYGREHQRFKDFIAFLRDDLEVMRRLIERETKGVEEEDDAGAGEDD